jgi:hypothetical protein
LRPTLSVVSGVALLQLETNNQGETAMKNTIKTTLLGLVCAFGMLSGSAATATTPAVTCNGVGAGTCYAATMPSGWTIQAGSTAIAPNGMTATWQCGAPSGYRTVTAIGVGSAQVQCRRF